MKVRYFLFCKASNALEGNYFHEDEKVRNFLIRKYAVNMMLIYKNVEGKISFNNLTI